VPVEQVVGDVGFDLAGVCGFGALDVAAVAVAVGVHAGDEGDSISRRRPDGTTGATTHVRDLPRIYAARVGDPELSGRDVGHPLAVRRPARLGGAGGRTRELARDTAARGLHFGDSCPPVGVDVSRPHRVQQRAAIGRHLRIAHILDRGEILECHWTLNASLRGKIDGKKPRRREQ